MRFVEVTVLVVCAQHVLQLTHRRSGSLRCRLPFSETCGVDRQHLQRRGLRRLVRLEQAHFVAIDERRVVRVCTEAHRRTEQPRRSQLRHVALRCLDGFIGRCLDQHERLAHGDDLDQFLRLSTLFYFWSADVSAYVRRQLLPGCRVRGTRVTEIPAQLRHVHRRRPRRNTQTRARLQVVELEQDVGAIQRDVGAALNIRRAAVRIVDRLAVDRDAHQVQGERILRAQLARERLDVDAFVVIENRRLVVDDLDDDVRSAFLREAVVDHVFRLHVAAALVLGLRRRQAHLLRDGIHGTSRTRGCQSDVVAVNDRGAPIEPLILRVTDEAQAHVGSLGDLRHRAAQLLRVVRGNHGAAALLELQRSDRSPRRIVDARDDLAAGCARTQPRLVRQLGQRIVVPELDFDAAVERATLRRVVRGDRHARTATVADDRLVRYAESFLQRQRSSMCARPGKRQVIGVDARVTLAERHVVGVADQLDRDVLLLLQVLQPTLHLRDERFRNFRRFVVEQRLDQIADAGAMRVAFLEAHLTNGLHTADLHALEVLLDQHLLVDERSLGLVVPHLHFDAPVHGAPFRGRVGRDRSRGAGPLVRDRLGRQRQARLQELSNFAGALARQPGVVAVDTRQLSGERLVVGVAHQMQAHVTTVAQIVEHLAQRLDVALRNVRDARVEADRRHDVRELHRPEPFCMDGSHLDAIARLLLQQLRIVRP